MGESEDRREKRRNGGRKRLTGKGLPRMIFPPTETSSNLFDQKEGRKRMKTGMNSTKIITRNRRKKEKMRKERRYRISCGQTAEILRERSSC